ncbi:carbon-nitrogen hydrolase family protein [Rhodopseudomonas palustris]|uniref:carbon-nitrogen hydrolase family protein n=1 Tax=Rhodopseudomonas palustris TaxID=1076 RepID=UPI000E5AA1CC|nr:carbon-nitrogen hydrolase family protein [Rhodopseudomonas palustris]QLH70663.1 carbon-nitrogen hydrolase family protein [Rhodopseudomonas palustris]RHZ91612.1 carbon-nitrogen hydrolase family protein [Rhodopseudomonas palustris]
MLPHFKAAAIHAAPVFLDKTATTKKAISLIREAVAAGAELVAFPETYIPAFPVWAALWAPIDNHDLFVRMADQSVLIDGPEVKAIRDEARRLGVVVSIGISEKSPASVGGIWNSNLLIGEDGEILNHHRKLVPTFYEKLIWSAGDGAGLRVVDTRLGKIGQLICGENTNPLARYALIAQGEQFHISSWPPVWPTRRPAEGGNYHIAAATRIRASAHCFEAKVFGLVTSGVLDKAARDMLVARDPSAAAVLDGTPRAATFFLDPTGEQIGEALCEDEGILYADIDLNRCVEPKQFHDVVGYYNRFDVFAVSISRRRLTPATFVDDLPLPAVVDNVEDKVGRAPNAAPVVL